MEFRETVFEQDDTGGIGRHLKLIRKSGEIILELRGPQINEAIQLGLLDWQNLHYSMFQYAQMTLQGKEMTAVGDVCAGLCIEEGTIHSGNQHPMAEDLEFLSSCNIRWP